MRTIRNGIFETNSSSTHSLTLCSEEDYEEWKKGDLIFDRYNDELIDPKDCDRDENGNYCDSYQYLTYSEFDEIDYETFYQEHITKNGEKVIAFGYFGYEG